MEPKNKFMIKAIEVAKDSAKNDEYAIGAVIVKDDEIIATGEVRLRRDKDPTAHAEIVAIRNACKKLNSRALKYCIIYSTQECCPMCSAAIVWAKMKGIVFGANSKDAVNKGTDNYSWRQIDISCKKVVEKSGADIEVVGGFMRDECAKLIGLSQ